MSDMRAWVGGYTSQVGGGMGIGALTTTGGRADVAIAAQASDPSYLALSPDGTVLYAVREGERGALSAFAVTDGGLSPLGTQPTGGADPCHVSIDPLGEYALVANYSSGSVSVLPVDQDGRLGEAIDVVQHHGSGPDRGRQDGPHAHMVSVDPAGQRVFVVDLGIDAVVTYALDRGRGSLDERGRLELPAGTGPRHLAFHPSGHAAYVVGELDSTLTVCTHDQGVLTAVAVISTRPAQATGPNLPAAVVVAPDARHVHVTNRGDDTIATFALDPDGLDARLVSTTPCGGHWPRDLVQSADGRTLLVANERSGVLSTIAVGPGGQPRRASIRSTAWPAPTCIVMHAGSPWKP